MESVVERSTADSGPASPSFGRRDRAQRRARRRPALPDAALRPWPRRAMRASRAFRRARPRRVEPSGDRPPLAEVLDLPPAAALPVRIIEVPHETHATLDHADRLPLFQMIAKNVGIRRARGGSCWRRTSMSSCPTISSDARGGPAERGPALPLRSLRRDGRHPRRRDRRGDAWPVRRRVIRINRFNETVDVRTGTVYPIYRGSFRPTSRWLGDRIEAPRAARAEGEVRAWLRRFARRRRQARDRDRRPADQPRSQAADRSTRVSRPTCQLRSTIGSHGSDATASRGSRRRRYPAVAGAGIASSPSAAPPPSGSRRDHAAHQCVG